MLMIARTMLSVLLDKSKGYPVISITGPRQSGKTTLIKSLFSGHFYSNLESPDTRQYASTDPRSFLDQAPHMIIDEVQRVPELLSYIQGLVDEDKNRSFVILGSQNLLISEKISQSLAGRVFVANLYPLSLEELREEKLLSGNLVEQLFKGFYPRIYSESLDPSVWYENYIQTYLERDVRSIKAVSDLMMFQKFMGLLAGRTGQLLNLTSLANDTGVSVPTVKSWISVLEASFIIKLLQPYHSSWNKRLMKSPKMHFLDTGLVCALLKINRSIDLAHHPLIGSIFESFVFSEFLKKNANFELNTNMYYWKDKTGREVDLLLESGNYTEAIEVKFGQTISADYFSNLKQYMKISQSKIKGTVIYGGKETQKREGFSVKSWTDI